MHLCLQCIVHGVSLNRICALHAGRKAQGQAEIGAERLGTG